MITDVCKTIFVPIPYRRQSSVLLLLNTTSIANFGFCFNSQD